ncbi:SIS domain-containing protein [Cerasicoccus maritimus]|uniref:SIS domain-containing protein n=1 Tax=Cerasicoccus maritimus TaxID=490089 RepID=UPI002852C6D7|nr:SIS domain-containing protein [Cerasicoccus maritimus]
MKTADTADEFLACAADFQLGQLDTEQPHPLTQNLSAQCKDDLPAAVAALKAVDQQALATMAERLAPATDLVRDIHATWANGGRIFLAGCGATGRLSIALETFCREGLVPEALQDKVIGFMAGGDAALIRSIEGFEDFPSYGERQLRELGFGAQDLLIASTEGGETPWVIGAAEEAARISERAPWFCYCNPDELLCQLVERSRRVIENDGIRKWNLAVGPMGIAGSTRMQSSTVLQYGVGLALELAAKEDFASQSIADRLAQFAQTVDALDWNFLAEFIARETEIYQQGDRTLYVTEDFGVTVLTDTTERSPTFSLPVFENYTAGQTNEPLSLTYLTIASQPSVTLAWRQLLRRDPRCLTWPDELPVTRHERLMGYDIGARAAHNRALSCGEARHHVFDIDRVDGAIIWSLGKLAAQPIPVGLPLLDAQTLLKMLLNAHSTLVMGCIGRYEGNLMTYVKPSNNKLIDRAIRYIQTLQRKANGECAEYATICRELYHQRATLAPDEPIVLKTLAALKQP